MIGKNNPFNIRYRHGNKWRGSIGVTKGFVDFSDIRYGIRAAAYLLMQSYRKAGYKTYAQMIYRFAPPSENNTQAYIDFVVRELHVFPFDVPSTKSDFAALLHFMWIMEQGRDSHPSPYPSRWIFDIITDFGLKIYKL